MITLKELNRHNYPTSKEIDANLEELLIKINKIRKAYGKPMIVTSGLRSDEKQKALIAAGKSTATKSNHLTGRAVDIADADGKFYDWCKANEKALEDAGLYCEERMGGWQHLQTVPPRSGKRWFFP